MAALTRQVVRRPGRSDAGAELIELALVLPILLVVVAGIVDFGFLFQRFAAVTNAAREGARVAVLPNANDNDVKERVAQVLKATGLDPGVAVVPDPARCMVPLPSGATVELVTVEVTYPAGFSSLGPFIQLVGGRHVSSIQLRGTAVMRTESVSSSTGCS